MDDAITEYLRQSNALTKIWRQKKTFGWFPSEYEIVSHLIVPFFRSLGWPPQNIGVEWDAFDVVLFDALPRTRRSCFLIVEAKPTIEQVTRVDKEFQILNDKLGSGLAQCNRMVSNGRKYWLSLSETTGQTRKQGDITKSPRLWNEFCSNLKFPRQLTHECL
ncbi:MAG: hypothetical protein SGI88_05695 [Candidatus Hydrogenedentes bacterium]|nr:hypothetical protein [Candidatus Hydrogenedentota bacterium]